MICKYMTVSRFWLVPLFALSGVVSTNAQDDTAKSQESTVEMLTCNVLVIDPDGNPVDDATVFSTGLRSKLNPSDHWGWDDEYGPLPKLKTNEQGVVEMPYPKFLTEKIETGWVTWTVEHPDFVDFREDRNVSDAPAEIQLARGFRIAVTAVSGENGEKIVDDLYAVIGGSRKQWKLHKGGMLVSPMFAKRDCTMRVVQLAANKPMLFSKTIELEPGNQSRIRLKDVKLFKGTRVEGRLDDVIARPVRNGHVSIQIMGGMPTIGRKDISGWSDDNFGWSDKTPINEDGTFVFESLPSGEVLQMIAVCDDGVSAMPELASVLKFYPEGKDSLSGSQKLPQLVAIGNELVEPTIVMEEATSVRVTVKAPDGQPLVGAEVVMWPNQYWFRFGSQVLGTGHSLREMLVGNRLGTFEYDRTIRYKGVTDDLGITTIKNLPVNVSGSLRVSFEGLEMPISGTRRDASVELKPSEVAKITIRMQEEGTDKLGGAIDDDEK